MEERTVKALARQPDTIAQFLGSFQYRATEIRHHQNCQYKNGVMRLKARMPQPVSSAVIAAQL